MWGVAFELDARLVLPASSSASKDSASQGSTGRSNSSGEQQQQQQEADLGSAHPDLQEDVYGPFSGQVRWDCLFCVGSGNSTDEPVSLL